jgi:hypothetical protein
MYLAYTLNVLGSEGGGSQGPSTCRCARRSNRATSWNRWTDFNYSDWQGHKYDQVHHFPGMTRKAQRTSQGSWCPLKWEGILWFRLLFNECRTGLESDTKRETPSSEHSIAVRTKTRGHCVNAFLLLCCRLWWLCDTQFGSRLHATYGRSPLCVSCMGRLVKKRPRR